VVGNSVSVVNIARCFDQSGQIEEVLGNRCFTGINMGDDSYVPDGFGHKLIDLMIGYFGNLNLLKKSGDESRKYEIRFHGFEYFCKETAKVLMEKGKRVLMSTAYLPPVPYVAILAKADEVLIEQYETYPKQTYRNRCEIYSANGKIPLIIPVNKPGGNHTMTKDILVSNHEKWQVLHWRAIHAAYANSPFFLYYMDGLKPFFTEAATSLLDFNTRLMKAILDLLGIEVKINLTGDFDLNPENVLDFRRAITPKKTFDEFASKEYYQSFNEKHGFIPNLSIIDLLFHMGPEAGEYLM
jgi:hypothetical protein